MHLSTCLPFCHPRPTLEDDEPPSQDILHNRTSLESLQPEPVVSLTTKNEGLTSGEDEFGIGGVRRAKEAEGGLVKAGGMGVVPNVSFGQQSRDDANHDKSRESQPEREFNMEHLGTCGRDIDAEKHIQKLRKRDFWKRPFRRIRRKIMVIMKGTGKGSNLATKGTQEVESKTERFSVEDGRISREVDVLV